MEELNGVKDTGGAEESDSVKEINSAEDSGSAGDGNRLSELELENQKLREENELLKEYRASLPLKERIYDRIPLNLKQLDLIIGILMAALIAVIALGLLDR